MAAEMSQLEPRKEARQTPQDGHESRGMVSTSDSSHMSDGPALVSDIELLYLSH